jgi:hypothetical protein
MIMKIKIIYAFILIVVLVLLCPRVYAKHKCKHENGGMYGSTYLVNKSDKLFHKVVVTIKEINSVTSVDSNGLFYFKNIPPGIYTIVVKSEGFMNTIVKNIEISEDSISIVPDAVLEYDRANVFTWSGTKTGNVDINLKGKIEGKVSSGIPVEKAYVKISGTFWYAETDSLGRYCIKNILPGRYCLTSGGLGKQWYHITKVCKVFVKADTISIVDIFLRAGIIPEEPLPYNWQERYK